MSATNTAFPRVPASSVTPTPARTRAEVVGERWLLAFVAFEILCQVGLFVLGATSLRLPLRIANYAFSLVLLVLIRSKARQPHPASALLPFILLICVIECFNPQGDRLIAGLAQISLYFAVLAPLTWVSRLQFGWSTLRRVLLLLWLFYTANAVTGVLQIEFPGQFSASVSENYDAASLTPHMLKLSNGATIIRPMGLTDTPGGAAVGGVYTIILGMGLLLTERNVFLRGGVVAAMMCGLFCVFICQGRTNLIIVAIAATVLLVVLARRKMFERVSGLLSAFALITLFATSMAFATGGKAVVDRFYTLIADDNVDTVYSSRGRFLEDMFSETGVEYPLGAGLGRWGMMNFYFGGRAPSVWAEMMWQALLYDGGWPLVILYAAMLSVVVRQALLIALRTRHDALACWAAVICGYDIAAIAASFSFPLFSVSLGMEVILLNACLYACYRFEQRRTSPITAQAVADFKAMRTPTITSSAFKTAP